MVKQSQYRVSRRDDRGVGAFAGRVVETLVAYYGVTLYSEHWVNPTQRNERARPMSIARTVLCMRLEGAVCPPDF
jgi:hypothetical protein